MHSIHKRYHWWQAAALILTLLRPAFTQTIQAQTKADTATSNPDRCCISENGAYPVGDINLIRERFKFYKDLGVNIVRSELAWRDMEKKEGQWSDAANLGYFRAAADAGFQIKLNVGTICSPPKWFLDAHPDARIINQNGSYSHNMISPWYAGFHQLLEEKTERIFQYLSQHPEIVAHLAFIDPDFGPASEPIYPAAWTMGPNYKQGQTFWFYGDNAQADFAQKMEAKYGSIQKANAAWKTSFGHWSDVKIPQPGTLPGPFWADVLTWYRDTKRDFILWQLHDFQTVMAKYLSKPVPLILYIPGRNYTDDDWNKAVASGNGNPSIKLMCDSRFLIQTGAKEHCWLQYTGCDNAAEVAHLRDYMHQNGYDTIPIWGENAGMNPRSANPLGLADIVIKYGLYGLDYTHSNWIFEKDTITLNTTAPQLKEAYSKINQAYARNLTSPRPALGRVFKMI